MRLRALVALTLLASVAPACDGPTAGEVSIGLVTPSSSDGAILFKVRTPSSKDLGELTAACSGCQAFSYRVSESELYGVVTGPLTSGPIARLAVSDLGVSSAYVVTILEISGLDHRLRSDVGYELRLSR
jgi:hypothetical protein